MYTILYTHVDVPDRLAHLTRYASSLMKYYDPRSLLRSRGTSIVHGMANTNVGIYLALQESWKYTLTLCMIDVLASTDFF